MDKPEKLKDIRKNKEKQRTGGQKLLRLVCTCLIVYLVLSFGSGFLKIYQLQKELLTLEEEIDELKESNQKLSDEAEYLQSPEAVEKIAREKLGLIKEGEIVILRAKETEH